MEGIRLLPFCDADLTPAGFVNLPKKETGQFEGAILPQ
jgi:hypothetical protein